MEKRDAGARVEPKGRPRVWHWRFSALISAAVAAMAVVAAVGQHGVVQEVQRQPQPQPPQARSAGGDTSVPDASTVFAGSASNDEPPPAGF